ncbi:MAG: galactokinase [Verrucomicrobiota bacterium]|jgi:galactokinase
MTLDELARQTAQQFAKTRGRPPRWIVAAPGRVNLIGEHTDYNDGFVLPMAIERYLVMAADYPLAPPKRPVASAKRSEGGSEDGSLPSRSSSSSSAVSVFATHFNETAQIEVSKPMTKGEPKWSNYIRGVIAGFQRLGEKIPALDVLLHSTVPLGGGLSSSAALEVAAATLLEVVTGRKLDPVEKALLCQKAEHEFAGMPCGIMDQFISVMGRENHLLLIDCRSCRTELVPLDDPSVAVLIVNSNVKHELTGSEYPARRQQCELAARILGVPSLRDTTADALEDAKGRMDEVVYRRARHVIGEIERTVHAAEGIRASNWPTVGQLMYASHYSLRDDYEVSCHELDAVVDIAGDIGIKGGVYGCRMTGGGFGGCAVALVKSDAVEAISPKIASDYKKKTGIEATIFSSRPAAGATVIKA